MASSVPVLHRYFGHRDRNGLRPVPAVLGGLWIAPVVVTDQQLLLAVGLTVVLLAVAGGVGAWLARARSSEAVAGARDSPDSEAGEAGSPVDGGVDREGATQDAANEQSDPDLVCSLVAANGGRMRQADIVESVDWSKAKVSRLLTQLEAEDRIVKIRLGRENLISLRGCEPRLARSPYEAPDDDR